MVEKRILLIGGGFVARPCAEYVVRRPENKLTVACRTLSAAHAFCHGLKNAFAIALDASNTYELEAVIAQQDLVISLIPYKFHVPVVQAAIKSKTHVITTSYVSPAMRVLDSAAFEAGITVLNEIGFDPGVDHLYAIKIIDEVHSTGGKIKSFRSYGGGLPAPEVAKTNPLQFKFSWSARGVFATLLNAAAYIESGRLIRVSSSKLMDLAHSVQLCDHIAFDAYPNRDSTPFREFYGIPEAQVVQRCNLRYPGFCALVRALVRIGWLDGEEKTWLKDSNISWAEATARSIGANDALENTLIACISELCNFSSAEEKSRILDMMRWIGLFSSSPLVPSSSNLLDILCAHIEKLAAYNPGERDMCFLQHRFEVERADGTEETIVATLEAYGDPKEGGWSAMARTVGIPCGVATQLVLDGKIDKKGVLAPYEKKMCKVLREEIAREGIQMVETIV